MSIGLANMQKHKTAKNYVRLASSIALSLR